MTHQEGATASPATRAELTDVTIEAVALTAGPKEAVGIAGVVTGEGGEPGGRRVAGSAIRIGSHLSFDGDELSAIPPGVGSEDAALAHVLATALHAVRARGPRPAESVAVVGGTPLGLATALVLLACGIGKVALIDEHEECRELADGLGAIGCSPPSSDDELGGLQERLGGYGPDVVFECHGGSQARRLAIEAVRPAGRVVLARGGTSAVDMNPNLLAMTDKRVQGCQGYGGADLRAVLDLIADGRLRASVLVADDTPPLHQLPAAARMADSSSCRSVVGRRSRESAA